MFFKKIILFVIAFSFQIIQGQNSNDVWHDKERKIHYVPDGEGFLLKNGTQKFNRALYGTNTAFRVETGDVPEFAMYMPGMGGNFKLGLIKNNKSKWLTEADEIETRYTTGKMSYKIHDELLQDQSLEIEIMALANSEGFILKVSGVLPDQTDLIWAFGGVSGKRFSRNGDIGADPETVFYMLPEYTRHNYYDIEEDQQRFTVDYGWDSKEKITTKRLIGSFPKGEVKLASVHQLETPVELFNSKADSLLVLTGRVESLKADGIYWKIENPESTENTDSDGLVEEFIKAEEKLKTYEGRVNLKTPDPYLNKLGEALAYAGDAIWEAPAYLHGAVAWRMHLNAWRGASVANPLGWHDRAESHFESYGNAQVIDPPSRPVVADTVLNLARQKEEIGNAMFSRGYICRHPNRNDVAHHYDMNLIFISQLLQHFDWTGDKVFLKKMWPVIKRHLEWEKRNFDSDGNGLYDAYAAIWASDGLQYNGGGVTYTSAYNYAANKKAAEIAELLGENSEPYIEEAARIYEAVQQELWLPEKGHYAEYKDLMGKQLLHETPGVWTIYHAMDEGLPDDFQAHSMLNYVSTQIPHIPVRAEGLAKDDLELISTTNWQPYTWSVNNVALAENLHTSLAYWQGNQPEQAYKLWESALIESMYLGAAPGGFEQLSFYDAIRGELYRDFADPVGVAARTLVEGLFGITPKALENKLEITPGFPEDWKEASLEIPNVSLAFQQNGGTSEYTITSNFSIPMNLSLRLPVSYSKVNSVTINGQDVDWKIQKDAVGVPKLIVEYTNKESYDVVVKWEGEKLIKLPSEKTMVSGRQFELQIDNAQILAIKDPQEVFASKAIDENTLIATLNPVERNRYKTFFVQLQQGDIRWWAPVSANIKPALEITAVNENESGLEFFLHNNLEERAQGKIIMDEFQQEINLGADETQKMKISSEFLVPGTNLIELIGTNYETQTFKLQNWEIKDTGSDWETIDLSGVFNSKITEIFEKEYLSPRPDSPTLMLPTQGIGNWCYPKVKADIDDSGLREKAGKNNEIKSPQGIPFKTPSEVSKENIAFTSLWDNFPAEIAISLSGKASQVYLLMSGSTNAMQSQLINAEVKVTYADGSSDILQLRNPENWWPIEQDYINDGYAFDTNAPVPPRLYLKSGEITREFTDYSSIKGFTNHGTDGGAATILDLPLNPEKSLKHLEVKTIANDVIVGLMAATLKR